MAIKDIPGSLSTNSALLVHPAAAFTVTALTPNRQEFSVIIGSSIPRRAVPATVYRS
jgi:hypothetical protein